MPHFITGQLRKAPYTKEGANNNGAWKMYGVDLSERMKVRNRDTGQDDVVYTNYRATFFAKEGQIEWYDQAFQEGKIVSVQCDTLYVKVDGQYTNVEMINPRLAFSQRSEGQQQQQQRQPRQQQQQPQNQGGWGAPQQPQQSNQFDDDIPF